LSLEKSVMKYMELSKSSIEVMQRAKNVCTREKKHRGADAVT